MMTFDLPLDPLDDGAYVRLVNQSPLLGFATREAAIAHAMDAGNERSAQGLQSVLNIEGGDRRWRVFAL